MPQSLTLSYGPMAQNDILHNCAMQKFVEGSITYVKSLWLNDLMAIFDIENPMDFQSLMTPVVAQCFDDYKNGWVGNPPRMKNWCSEIVDTQRVYHGIFNGSNPTENARFRYANICIRLMVVDCCGKAHVKRFDIGFRGRCCPM